MENEDNGSVNKKVNASIARAKMAIRNGENYHKTWYKPVIYDQNMKKVETPLSDLELRIPSISIRTWHELDSYSVFLERWSRVPEEDWGLRDYSGPETEMIQKVRGEVSKERRKAKSRYVKRQMSLPEFKRHLESSIDNIRENLSSPLILEGELESLEYQLEELNATPYHNVPIAYYRTTGRSLPDEGIPYVARTITEREWQNHLKGMEDSGHGK